LQNALQEAGLSVSPSGSVHVHAETDVEALVEPVLLRDTQAAAARADLVIAVDWERPEDSVLRVAAFLKRSK
jgi:hypothetical protein